MTLLILIKLKWLFQVMCRLDGGTLAEIDDAAENTYLQAAAKLKGGNINRFNVFTQQALAAFDHISGICIRFTR